MAYWDKKPGRVLGELGNALGITGLLLILVLDAFADQGASAPGGLDKLVGIISGSILVLSGLAFVVLSLVAFYDVRNPLTDKTWWKRWLSFFLWLHVPVLVCSVWVLLLLAQTPENTAFYWVIFAPGFLIGVDLLLICVVYVKREKLWPPASSSTDAYVKSAFHESLRASFLNAHVASGIVGTGVLSIISATSERDLDVLVYSVATYCLVAWCLEEVFEVFDRWRNSRINNARSDRDKRDASLAKADNWCALWKCLAIVFMVIATWLGVCDKTNTKAMMALGILNLFALIFAIPGVYMRIGTGWLKLRLDKEKLWGPPHQAQPMGTPEELLPTEVRRTSGRSKP